MTESFPKAGKSIGLALVTSRSRAEPPAGSQELLRSSVSLGAISILTDFASINFFLKDSEAGVLGIR